MPPAQVAFCLAQLIGDGEEGGLTHEELIDALENMVAIRESLRE